MKGQKIYKFVCYVSSRERIFVFIHIQPATDVRVAFRIMRERLKNYYRWKYVSLIYWRRWDKSDSKHFKIY